MVKEFVSELGFDPRTTSIAHTKKAYTAGKYVRGLYGVSPDFRLAHLTTDCAFGQTNLVKATKSTRFSMHDDVFRTRIGRDNHHSF
mmetsp:Transcript_28479/g.58833  ORF Transcript_28479/g.58833 Transcript_28479/m.58833 type:complete len:86 (-) Transcript_28479:967-1224(-)